MAKTLAVALLAAALLVWPSAGDAQSEPALEAATEPSAAPLVIGSGDLIDVSIFDAPDLSGRFRVDQKGDVEMPLVAAIHVAGLMADQAATLIENRYVQAEILVPAESRSTVFIEEYANQGITVSGEVKSPGVYPALGVRMLHDVVTAAGGITQQAESKVVITRHSDPQNPVTVAYNPEVLPMVIPRIQILPGDTVMVPRSGLVYVLGAVTKPGGYVLEGHDTVTTVKVMALAGGPSHAPALNNVQLVRSLQGGRKLMITVPMNEIIKGKAPDVSLKDGDILYIPTNTKKVAMERVIAAAVAISTAIVIYKVAYH